MRFEFVGTIRIGRHIIAVRKAIAKQHMHHAASESAVGAGTQDDLDIRLLHRIIVVNIDDRDLRAPLFSCAGRVSHHIDLRVDGVGAPDHDEIRLRHLARIDARDPAGAGGESGPCNRRADRPEEPRIFFLGREAIDTVTHHQPHRAGIIIRPHRLRAEVALGSVKTRRDLVQRLVPCNANILPGAFRPAAAHRKHKPVGMVDTLGVARDLRADDAGGVGLLFRASDATDGCVVNHLDVERAGRRAIMRAGGMLDVDFSTCVHAQSDTSTPRNWKRSKRSTVLPFFASPFVADGRCKGLRVILRPRASQLQRLREILGIEPGFEHEK